PVGHRHVPAVTWAWTVSASARWLCERSTEDRGFACGGDEERARVLLRAQAVPGMMRYVPKVDARRAADPAGTVHFGEHGRPCRRRLVGQFDHDPPVVLEH